MMNEDNDKNYYSRFYFEMERIDHDPNYFRGLREREIIGDYTGYETGNHEVGE